MRSSQAWEDRTAICDADPTSLCCMRSLHRTTRRPPMLLASHISALQDDATSHWHMTEAPNSQISSPLDQLVLEQHRANFDLWHREDAARDPLAGPETIVAVKRAIDTLNQRRNDLVERLDALLLSAVRQNNNAPLHSETPGLIIDRLSILSLKLFHTREEAGRSDAAKDHKARNRERLQVIAEQRSDLTLCLAELWSDIEAGRRRFKLYRQMKMYNDPTLNPVLYGASAIGGA